MGVSTWRRNPALYTKIGLPLAENIPGTELDLHSSSTLGAPA